MIRLEKLPDMPELSFDEVSHIYKLNGLMIPSVTTVMEPLKVANYKGISDATLENAANKGTAVHNFLENWVLYGIEDIPPEHKGYFDAFLEWWNLYNPVVVATEVRIYHKLLGYAGTADLLAYIGDELVLIDYKSTYTVSDMLCGVQLEAYAQAFESHGIHIDRKKILHLTKDGKHKFIDYPAKDSERWRVFGSLKCVYDYIHRQ